MRNNFILFGTLAIFFIMATATSQEEFPAQEYDSNIELSGNNIIITSESSVNIENGTMFLVLNAQSVDRESFFRTDYFLEGLTADTLPFSSFVSTGDESVSFPNGEMPSDFSLNFIARDTSYFKNHAF